MRTIKRDIVGAFIFSKDNCLLLGKSDSGTYHGQWIIPGGGMEKGESPLQALQREVMEETGLDIRNLAVEKMDIDLKGESKKILRETNEEVLGKYTFFNFVVHINKESSDIKIYAEDDFIDPVWKPISLLHTLDLSSPTVTSLKHLGIL